MAFAKEYLLLHSAMTFGQKKNAGGLPSTSNRCSRCVANKRVDGLATLASLVRRSILIVFGRSLSPELCATGIALGCFLGALPVSAQSINPPSLPRESETITIWTDGQ